MNHIEALKVARDALTHAMAICDAVPSRLHENKENSQLAHLGRLVNCQPDGSHGYAMIRDAIATIATIIPSAFCPDCGKRNQGVHTCSPAYAVEQADRVRAARIEPAEPVLLGRSPEDTAWQELTQVEFGHASANGFEARKLYAAPQPITQPAPAPVPAQTGTWISVGDRLPDFVDRDDTPCIVDGRAVLPTLTSATVLVALAWGGVVRTDKLIAIEGGEPWFDGYGSRVTHWMPLPAAPEAKPTEGK